jgi:hypothetical protein
VWGRAPRGWGGVCAIKFNWGVGCFFFCGPPPPPPPPPPRAHLPAPAHLRAHAPYCARVHAPALAHEAPPADRLQNALAPTSPSTRIRRVVLLVCRVSTVSAHRGAAQPQRAVSLLQPAGRAGVTGRPASASPSVLPVADHWPAAPLRDTFCTCTRLECTDRSACSGCQWWRGGACEQVAEAIPALETALEPSPRGPWKGGYSAMGPPHHTPGVWPARRTSGWALQVEMRACQ